MSGHSKTDKPVTLVVLIALVSISIFLLFEISQRQMLVFMLGTGIGISLMHSGFGFSGGWRSFVVKRESSLVRAQLILFAVCAVVMFPLVTGPAYSAALAPVSFSVLFGAFLFGIGMQLGGGCGSGSLFTVGQGQNDMLVTLLFFILGAFLGSLHLPWWTSFFNYGEISTVSLLGWPGALVLQLLLLLVLYQIFFRADRRRNGEPRQLSFTTGNRSFLNRLIYGPWPVFWGLIMLALLAIAVLLLTGHTWSITFAFGLWGAKIWQALGGTPELSPYWSGGYPARALSTSVLYDVTSVMNFGIILGAALAAALSRKFAPSMKVTMKRLMIAMAGGLLLGYGARLAFGCNIGALFAGMATGSVHAWLWLLGGVGGNLVGIHLRVMAGMDRRLQTEK